MVIYFKSWQIYFLRLICYFSTPVLNLTRIFVLRKLVEQTLLFYSYLSLTYLLFLSYIVLVASQPMLVAPSVGLIILTGQIRYRYYCNCTTKLKKWICNQLWCHFSDNFDPLQLKISLYNKYHIYFW